MPASRTIPPLAALRKFLDDSAPDTDTTARSPGRSDVPSVTRFRSQRRESAAICRIQFAVAVLVSPRGALSCPKASALGKPADSRPQERARTRPTSRPKRALRARGRAAERTAEVVRARGGVTRMRFSQLKSACTVPRCVKRAATRSPSWTGISGTAEPGITICPARSGSPRRIR